MRYYKILVVSLFFASCSDNEPDNQNIPDVVIEPIVGDTSNAAVDSAQVKFGWLDSLQSENVSSRLSAFQRYKKARASGNGDDSDMLTGYMKTYIYSHPKEFLSSYAFMNPADRVNMQNDLAYGIYSSSDKQYQKDLDEYFTELSKSCTDCGADLKKLLKDFKSKVEVRIKQLAR